MLVRRLTGAVLLLLTLDCSPQAPTPADHVIDAAREVSRVHESRIQGRRWSPVRAGTLRERPSAEALEFEGVAGEVLRSAARDTAFAHAAGVATLLLGRARESAAQLEQAARLSPQDARVWNDLAAARAAEASDDPARLPGALSAADRAIELNATGPEPYFNRALILTRLGLRHEAAQAWRDAAARETDRDWREEIDRRLAGVAAAGPGEVQDLEAALRSGDAAIVKKHVARNVETVRSIGETIRLASWAEAVARREPAAERILTDLRLLGTAIAETNGDRLLQNVVRHLDQNRARHAELAAVHLAYRDARLHYRDQANASDAELCSVAARFEALGSPMEHVARYYAANATFDRNRVEGARAMLERVLTEINNRGYLSLAAGVRKQLGLCYGFQGLWTASLLHLDRAFKAFSRIGEPVNAAFTEAILGEAYDRMGEVERGWRHRVAALNVLGTSKPDQRLVAVVIGAVHAEILRGDLAAARSLLTIARARATAVGNPLLTSEMMTREARVLMILQRAAAARALLQETKLVSSRIADPVARLRVDADIRVIEGSLVRDSDPRAAIDVITAAIRFYETHGFEILLPDAYLQRGRAYLAKGDAPSAIDDFTRGLDALDHQRANASTEIRTRIFDTVPELVGETLELLIQAGREREAYAVVERARSRTLTEALGIESVRPGTNGLDAIAASLPENALLVEYAVLRERVVAFCVTRRRGLTIVELPLDRGTLRKHVDELVSAISTRKPEREVKRLAAAVFDGIIEPLRPQLTGVGVLYVVPDRFLNTIPFGALFDGRRDEYLIEKYRIVIAPSGAFLLQRQRLTRDTEPALIVSDPSGDRTGEWLPAARREAAAIARLYRRSTLLGGSDATIQRFVNAARESALLHYAGHAGTDDAGGGFLPLAPSVHDDGRLDAAAISRLALPRTELVILSACATLRGSAARTEGMPSISRAFLAAGSPAVVGMLWEVEDEQAARLLLRFHEHLGNHRLPSAALQAAQTEMLRSDRESARHPASWAFAVLFGTD